MQAVEAVQHSKVELLALVVQAAAVQQHLLVQIILQPQEQPILEVVVVELVIKPITQMVQQAVQELLLLDIQQHKEK
jgi:hypothetical protein